MGLKKTQNFGEFLNARIHINEEDDDSAVKQQTTTTAWWELFNLRYNYDNLSQVLHNLNKTAFNESSFVKLDYNHFKTDSRLLTSSDWITFKINQFFIVFISVLIIEKELGGSKILQTTKEHECMEKSNVFNMLHTKQLTPQWDISVSWPPTPFQLLSRGVRRRARGLKRWKKPSF